MPIIFPVLLHRFSVKHIQDHFALLLSSQ
jgi:hypothetical protein